MWKRKGLKKKKKTYERKNGWTMHTKKGVGMKSNKKNKKNEKIGQNEKKESKKRDKSKK